MRNTAKITCLVLGFLLVISLSTLTLAEEQKDLSYFILKDEEENQITMTGRELDRGDHYIASNNKMYEVQETRGSIVYVKYVETVELPEITGELLGAQASGAAGSKGVVGIYHTHNAESYVPTSGTDSKENGKGDVLEVGKMLASTMEKLGLTVHWSDNSHLPHDGQAYLRSRRTAMELLKENPDTLIDVHRDATPPEIYETEIEGTAITKVRIVVGRQNQNRSSNLEYAKRIKAVGDKFFPGIIEGIFDARGNYNQDLGPKMILLEFGAHTNHLDQAEKAAEFFAKVIPAAAGLTLAERKPAQEQIGTGASKSAIWMIVIVTVVGMAFLLISRGKIGSFSGFIRREAGLPNIDDDNDQEPKQ